jgi:F-type H+-transporting ATPase subunit a
MGHHPFTWHEFLHPDLHGAIPVQIFFSPIAMVLIVWLGSRVKRHLLEAHDPVIPSDRLSITNIFELLIEFVVNLSDGIIGKKGRPYISLYGSFFIYILFCNFIGLVPGFSPPTSNLNVTLGLGLVSFGAYHYFGIKEHGPGYIKQFLGPFLLIAPLFFGIELFSHMFRPLTLGLRLAFNMFADHLVVEIFTGLTFVVVPVLFYLLGALVAVIQAFVFTLLSMIYASLALSHDH